MQDEGLRSTDSEDINDVLRQIERSFAIQFGFYELQHVETFGELCDIVERKIQLTDTQDCTSQQAFYKLRNALEISTVAHGISPETQLAALLPSSRRKRQVVWRSVEDQLGFKLDVIGISSTTATIILLAFLVSLAGFFISAKVAGICFLISLLGTLLAKKTGNTLEVKSLRECVEKMTCEHYSKSRRNPDTFNRKEIPNQVRAIFMDGLALPASALTREAPFV